MSGFALPWTEGSVERMDGSVVTDTAVIFTADDGQIEISDTEAAGSIARLTLAAPDLLKAAKRALTTLKAQGESVRPGNVLGALQAAIQKAEATS